MLQQLYPPVPTTVSDNLAIEFANSLFTEHVHGVVHIDRLELAEWRRWFAERCGRRHALQPTRAELASLRALRPVVRRVLESGGRPAAADVQALNHALAATPAPALVSSDGGFAVSRSATRPGWTAIGAAIALACAELLASGKVDRVRTCANPACTYLFYDGSRNRSRRWCDVAACGNLVRVRRARAAARSA